MTKESSEYRLFLTLVSVTGEDIKFSPNKVQLLGRLDLQQPRLVVTAVPRE